MSGIFISFEGVEGAGKTTQITRLRTALESQGYAVFATREPGGDSVAEAIRDLLLRRTMHPRAELLLFLAARAQNVEQVIRPNLEAGKIVLCDRFIDSSVAYQGWARGLGADQVAMLNQFAIEGCYPDMTLLLDIDPEIGLERQNSRNRMEEENLEFHLRVRAGFLAEAKKHPSRFHLFDATLSPEALHQEILGSVLLRLNAIQQLAKG